MRTPVIESQTLWRPQLLQSTDLNFQSVSLASSKIRINREIVFPLHLDLLATKAGWALLSLFRVQT